MFTNPEATLRPIVGQTYKNLYVKCNIAVGQDEVYDFPQSAEAPTGSKLKVVGPTYDGEEVAAFINLYVDYFGDAAVYPQPILANQVVEVTYNEGAEFLDSYIVDFYLP